MAGSPSAQNADPAALSVGVLTSKALVSPPITITPGASVTADLSLGRIFELVPNQNTTVNFTNYATDGTDLIIVRLLTSGTTTYVITFDPVFGGGGGTFTTSGTDASRAAVLFTSIGSQLLEILRTGWVA